jgi:hypothetical protein
MTRPCSVKAPVDALVLALAAVLWTGPAAKAENTSPPNAVTIFAARMTGNNVEDFLSPPPDVRFRNAYFAGAGYSRRLATFFEALDLEALGQIAEHFGGRHGDQWEFDGALGIRWTRFPWNKILPTSIAFDLGPSYETGLQPDEAAINGQTERWLAFWLAELEVGPPESLWSAVARIHHRSTGFGLFGKSGGSNSIALGIRRKF